MKYIEAKKEFIHGWATLGNQWGINRTMSQIHALLLMSPDPISTEDIMDELSISRGNTNMNVRELMNWGLVHKVLKQGERKEYFEAEKDMWKVTTCVAKERKKKELDPMLKMVEKLSKLEGSVKDKNIRNCKTVLADIGNIAQNTNKMMNLLIVSEESKFWKTVFKLFK